MKTESQTLKKRLTTVMSCNYCTDWCQSAQNDGHWEFGWRWMSSLFRRYPARAMNTADVHHQSHLQSLKRSKFWLKGVIESLASSLFRSLVRSDKRVFGWSQRGCKHCILFLLFTERKGKELIHYSQTSTWFRCRHCLPSDPIQSFQTHVCVFSPCKHVFCVGLDFHFPSAFQRQLPPRHTNKTTAKVKAIIWEALSRGPRLDHVSSRTHSLQMQHKSSLMSCKMESNQITAMYGKWEGRTH